MKSTICRMKAEWSILIVPLYVHPTGLLSMTEKERQTEKHAHTPRLRTIANSVVTTFGLIFSERGLEPPFAAHDRELRFNNTDN